MDRECIIKVENVSKEYCLGTWDAHSFRESLFGKNKASTNKRKLKMALDNVSFSVKRGETIGIIGSNGAGKSTLLKILSRITTPSSGQVYLDGRVSSMLEVGTGFHQELTGRENIYLNGAILGMSKKEIDSKLDSIIEFSECAEFIDTPVKRYSSGMYVKLAFAVASHLESEIVIMDEVLAVGDVKFQQKCLNKMKEIAEVKGRTILYVSHNMDTVRKLCKRCLVLQDGNLVFDGMVDEAIQKYMGEHLRTEASMDFQNYMRPGWLGRSDVRLLWAEYSQGSSVVNSTKKIELLLKFRCDISVENLGIRVELMDNGEKPFATAVKYSIFSGEAGQEETIALIISLQGIMNGTYKTNYTLFCIDAYGQSIDIDCVRGLDIVIKQDTPKGKLEWHNASWGNIQLPEMEIVEKAGDTDEKEQ